MTPTTPTTAPTAPMASDDPRHGTPAGYRAHRTHNTPYCQPCRQAATRAKQRWRTRTTPTLIPVIHAERRIRALQRIGWTLDEIAAAAGLTSGKSHITSILTHPTIHADTDQKIRAAYRRLAVRIPPDDGHYRRRARRYAASMGWASPLAWDDIDNPHDTPQGAIQ